MTPADKQKLTDAFNAAVRNSPYANEKVPGMVDENNKPVTRGMLIEGLLKQEDFYDRLEIALQKGRMTLDQYIVEVTEGLKRSIHAPPKPKR